jgi:hypothetical protein
VSNALAKLQTVFQKHAGVPDESVIQLDRSLGQAFFKYTLDYFDGSEFLQLDENIGYYWMSEFLPQSWNNGIVE